MGELGDAPLPEVPDIPEVTDVPEIPDEVLEVSEVSEIPEVPEEVPEVTDETVTSEVPEVSQTPEEMPEPPTDTADDTSAQGSEDAPTDLDIESVQQIREAADSFRQMEELDPGAWQALDGGQRLEALQTIEDRVAAIQGRPSVQVSAEPMEPDTFGGWDGQGISLNAAPLESDMPVEEFLNTIVHEGRHAYQDYAVQNPGVVADQNIVNNWADNMEPGHYLSAEDYGQEIYATQAVEADAWRYADRLTNAMIAQGFEE